MAPDPQICLDSLFDPAKAELLESRDRALRERLVGEVGERFASPQVERLTKKLPGSFRVVVGELPASVLEHVRVGIGVELARVDPEHVSGLARLDGDVRKRAS
jgi:hypothetical protein